ncbi:MAG: phosphate signaling complex protein PhoU [Caldimicrobium sp.]
MVRLALDRELGLLNQMIKDMAEAVNDMVRMVIKAFSEKDSELARSIISLDDQIDHYEHMIVYTALEIIALQQPVAKDLRKVVSAITIARNLERLADQVINIAESLLDVAKVQDGLEDLCDIDLLPMSKEALTMFEMSINSFVTADVKLAKEVILRDDIVDAEKTRFKEEIGNCLEKYPHLHRCALDYYVVVENLERVADLACNIAEAVIFIEEGRFVDKIEKKGEILRDRFLQETSIFQLLKKHARLITECMERLPLALEAYIEKNFERIEEVAKDIRDIEKEADKLKTNIRGHLPKGIILPVDKFELFMYLKEQDGIADHAEELLNSFLIYRANLPESFFKKLNQLLMQAIAPLSYFEELVSETFKYLITWNEESRERTKGLIRSVRHSQYLTEELAFNLKKEVFQPDIKDRDLNFGLRLIELVASISSRLENTADLLRVMIAK